MKKFIILSLFISLILTGCGEYSNDIYTVCEIDGDNVYVYNEDDFYKVSYNSIAPVDKILSIKEPALMLLKESGDYQFTEVIPGLYTGTLQSLSHYVDYLYTKDNCTYNITYSNSNTIQLDLTSDNYKGKISFNTSGEIRMYFINNSNKYILPPYISE